MTFDDILEQVIVLLKRQGACRIGYSKCVSTAMMTIWISSKEDLLYVHRVVDDEGKGLIWTAEV
jgi:hypothetical protein